MDLPSAAHEKIKLVEINPYLTCPLCKGYFIDATTISECLHSFCRSCIIKFLQENSHCPVCEVIINEAKPNIKLDKTLQDIVYKLVPELFINEMTRRQRFYRNHPELSAKVTAEERGVDTERTIFNPKDSISLSIEYISDDSTPGAIVMPPVTDSSKTSTKNNSTCDSESQIKRFLQCPGMCRIEVLKKFVQNKYNVNTNAFHIDVLYKRVPLPNHYTLIDIAYIYSWKRNEPMKFFFRITDKAVLPERFDYLGAPPQPEIFVTPTKTVRAIGDKTNSKTKQRNNEIANRKNKTPLKLAAESPKVDDDVDRIKDEIKNELQNNINNKNPVYTNITLNRTSNVEIITKVQKVSNKNGQPIGLNIIKQTVKKARPPTNFGENPKITGETEDVKNEPTPKDDKVLNENVNVARSKAQNSPGRIHKPSKNKVRKLGGHQNKNKADSNTENKTPPLEDSLKNLPVKIQQNPKVKTPVKTKTPPPQIEITERPSADPLRSEHRVDIPFDIDEEKSKFLKSIELTAKTVLQAIDQHKPENIAQRSPPKASQKRKSTSPVKNERAAKISKASPKTKHPKQIQNPAVQQMVNNVNNSASNLSILVEQSAQQTTSNNDLQSLFDSCKINIPSSLSITLKESSDDDRERSTPTPIKPVQNYIEILKLPDVSTDQKRIEQKLENLSNHGLTIQEMSKENDTTISRSASKSPHTKPPPNLPCKVVAPPKEAAALLKLNPRSAQTFQKMFEEAIKKPEFSNKLQPYIPAPKSQKSDLAESGGAMGGSKRNILEIASQLYKKTKLNNCEQEPELNATSNKNSVGKVRIPRLNTQKNLKPSKSTSGTDLTKTKTETTSESHLPARFQKTFANMHSASLGMNYTVSVSQNSPGFNSTTQKTTSSLQNENDLNKAMKFYSVQNIKIPAGPPVKTVKSFDLPDTAKAPETSGEDKSKFASETTTNLKSETKNGEVLPKSPFAVPLTLNAPVLGLPNQNGSFTGSAQPELTLNLSKTFSPKASPSSPKLNGASPLNCSIPPRSPKSNQNHSPRPSPNYISHKVSPNPSPKPNQNLSPRPNISPVPSPRATSKSSTQNFPKDKSALLTPNQLLEKYNLQNRAQLTASFNFNPATFGLSSPSQLAALQQAMILKHFEMQNRQNWLNMNVQYEKYLQSLNQSHLLTKEN